METSHQQPFAWISRKTCSCSASWSSCHVNMLNIAHVTHWHRSVYRPTWGRRCSPWYVPSFAPLLRGILFCVSWEEPWAADSLHNHQDHTVLLDYINCGEATKGQQIAVDFAGSEPPEPTEINNVKLLRVISIQKLLSHYMPSLNWLPNCALWRNLKVPKEHSSTKSWTKKYITDVRV